MSQAIAGTGGPARPVYIKKSPLCEDGKGDARGHGLFANRSFSEGEEVLSLKQLLVNSLDTERLLDTCANCFVWTEGGSTGSRLYVPPGTKVQTCGGCQRFRYCGKTCQKEAWNRGHKYECKLLKPLVSKDIPKAVLACIELLCRRINSLVSDEDWDMLCRLDSHVDDFKRKGSYSNMELMAMAASQFSLTQSIFGKELVAAMYARILSNSLTLITPTLDPLGIILDPTLGSINHSCDPNAYIMMSGAETSVRTLKHIAKDEEVLISYIDTTNPYPRRKYELNSRWFFDCKCVKCQKGGTLDEDKWAVELHELPEEVTQAGDMLRFELQSIGPADYVGESQNEQRVGFIQARAFALYEEEQSTPDSTETIESIKQAMQFCHRTGLWNLYRQPLAALRDDLIVNLLSVGDYTAAWAHCAKRYKYILPRLYPIPHHPVRVVQMWQMAMLAVYLASSEEGIGVEGVRMDLIAMMLVKQVLDVAGLSHGLQSAFTRSVRAKAEEMIEELKRRLGNADKSIMNRELEVQRDILMQMGDWAKM